MTPRTPEYGLPPLDEVAMGLQFAPLKTFRAAHLGLYWSRIREQYPITEDQGSIPPVIESPSLKPQIPQVQIMAGIPPVRCWFLSEDMRQLIQLQADRFIRNWRQVEGVSTVPYPRFPILFERFQQEWDGFLRFLEQESLAPPVINQCELTYVNSVPLGAGWSDFADVPDVFTILAKPEPGGFLPKPEVINWEVRYPLPDGKGRLHVSMSPVFRGRDFRLALNLTLVARGGPGGQGSKEDVSNWFAFAHDWVVNGFDQLTESRMHSLWKKKND